MQKRLICSLTIQNTTPLINQFDQVDFRSGFGPTTRIKGQLEPLCVGQAVASASTSHTNEDEDAGRALAPPVGHVTDMMYPF